MQFPYSKSLVMQSVAVATGNGVVMDTSDVATLAMQVTGTFVGTVTFEGTIDNSTWVAIQTVNLSDGSVGTTATAAGLYACSVAGLRQVRARVSAWTSGTITVTGFATSAGGGLSLADIDVAGTEAVDTELPAAVAINGTILKSVSTPVVGAALLVSDSTNLIQPLGDAANGLDVDVTRMAALAAGTALIGKVGLDQTTPGTTNKVTTDPITATPTPYNVTCTVADTEYSQALPASCRGFELQARTQAEVRYAFVTGKVAGSVAPFLTLKAGDYYASLPLNQGAAPSTLYVASSVAGTVVEILAWT
jgi:hypothetical protein